MDTTLAAALPGQPVPRLFAFLESLYMSPRRRTHLKYVMLLLMATLLMTPKNSAAEFYKYTDSEGIVCLTDNFDSIPARYKAKAVVEKVKESPPRQPEQAQSPAVAASERETTENNPRPAAARGFRWNFVLLVLIGLSGVVIARIMGSSGESRLAGWIRLAVFAGVALAAVWLNLDIIKDLAEQVTGKAATVRSTIHEQLENDKKPLKPLSQVVEEKMNKE
jgi:hypothetical protein